MQLLFQRLDDGQDNIILQQDPTNKNWLFIPLETEEDRKASLDPLQKRKEALEKKLSADASNNPTDKDKAIQREINEIDVKIGDLRPVDEYGDYRGKEGEVTKDYETKDSQGRYVYDQTIGIVDLAALEKSPGKNGAYFQKSTGNEEQAAFIEGHKTLLTENPDLFGGYRFDKDDNLEFVPDMEVPVDAPTSGKQTGITHNKAQIADFYLNKAQGQALLDSYINTENLDGQLESLIGGDSGEYYLENNLLGQDLADDAFVDIASMTDEQKKDEIRRFMLQQILGTTRKLYAKGDATKLGKEANEDFKEVIVGSGNNQRTFIF